MFAKWKSQLQTSSYFLFHACTCTFYFVFISPCTIPDWKCSDSKGISTKIPGICLIKLTQIQTGGRKNFVSNREGLIFHVIQSQQMHIYLCYRLVVYCIRKYFPSLCSMFKRLSYYMILYFIGIYLEILFWNKFSDWMVVPLQFIIWVSDKSLLK